MATKQQGIDVSQWQGDIAWDKVKKSGVQFAMLRAASSTHLDSKFIRNIESALAQGIPCGVYLYSYASTPAEALTEAEFLMETVHPYTLQYPVAFDIEDITQHHLTNAQRTDLVDTFCRRVAQEKYRPAVYTSLSWFNTMLELPRLVAYDKWIAQWDVPKCGFDGSVQLWQNSSRGRVDGIQGDVDTNLCYFDYSAISQKPVANNVTIIVTTPKKKDDLTVGTCISLSGTPLFATSTSETQVGHFSGQYWIYDEVILNGRIRLTNQQARVGKKPEGINVTGYADVTVLRALNGTVKI